MNDKTCIFNIQKFSIHDGPGIRTVVFFKGCPLRCYWCSNPESQNGKPEQMWDTQKNEHTTVGEYKSMDEIITEVMKDEVFYEESDGGVTLSGGEVLFQAEFATELLRQLKEKISIQRVKLPVMPNQKRLISLSHKWICSILMSNIMMRCSIKLVLAFP